MVIPQLWTKDWSANQPSLSAMSQIVLYLVIAIDNHWIIKQIFSAYCSREDVGRYFGTSGAETCGAVTQREAMLVSTISGRPGTLRDFVNLALPSGTDLNITELRHRCASMPKSPESIFDCSICSALYLPTGSLLSCVRPNSHAGSAATLSFG